MLQHWHKPILVLRWGPLGLPQRLKRLMSPSWMTTRKIADFISLSRRCATVLKQNIGLALGIKVVFLTLALSGHATLWMAVFADMGASLARRI
jgi:hypothetical protein